MKKTIMTIILASAIAVSLTACGGSKQESTAAKSEAAAASESKADESAEPAVKGEVADTGLFSVLIPEGWCAYPQADFFEDADEDGNYPLDPEKYALIKGGESEYDSLDHPTIYITYFANTTPEEQLSMTAMWYDEENISDYDITVNGEKAAAMEVKDPSFSDEEQFYVYQFVELPSGQEKGCFQVMVPVDMIYFEGVQATDADVMAVLESVKLN